MYHCNVWRGCLFKSSKTWGWVSISNSKVLMEDGKLKIFCFYIFGCDVFHYLHHESAENEKFKCPLQLMCICGKQVLLSIPVALMRLILCI